MGRSRTPGRPAGKISVEIRQTRPFASLEREASATLLRTGDVLHHAVESALRPWEVSPEQYNVLRILRGAGPEGTPTLTIAERMIEEAPGITRLLDRLEVKGMVRRQRCPEDRRQVLCHATPAALDLLGRIDGAMNEADDGALGTLSDQDKAQLIRLLDAVRASHT